MKPNDKHINRKESNYNMNNQDEETISPPSDSPFYEMMLMTKILNAMGSIVHPYLGVSPAQDNALRDSATLAAEGIARKLFEGIESSPNLNQHRWKAMVRAATRNAFMEPIDGGPLVELGQNEIFVAAVVICTASTVAPDGSAWNRAALTHYKEWLCKSLGLEGCPTPRSEEILRFLIPECNQPTSIQEEEWLEFLEDENNWERKPFEDACSKHNLLNRLNSKEQDLLFRVWNQAFTLKILFEKPNNHSEHALIREEAFFVTIRRKLFRSKGWKNLPKEIAEDVAQRLFTAEVEI